MSEEADHLRAVLEATADGILVVDENGKVVTSNRRFAELWCIPDELLARRSDDAMLDFVLGQLVDPAAFLSRVRELYGSRRENLDVLRFRDGRVVERFSAPLVRDGAVAGRVWSFRDVTEVRRAEAALRESEERFRTIYNMTPAMQHSLDSEWRIAEVSPRWLERLGYERAEVLGRKKSEFLTAESVARCEEVLPRLVALGRVTDVPLQYVAKSGELVDCLISVIARYGDRGEVTVAFVSAVDVGERKRAEEERRRLERQVQQAQKLESLGLLAGGIAHDFNNLLVSILGNADLVLGALGPGAAGHQELGEILAAGERAAALCKELMAYSGGGPLEMHPVDLAELVLDMAHLLDVSVPERVRLERELQAGLPAVEADAGQLRQVVMNLVANAAEAIGDGEGEIALRVGTQALAREELRPTLLGDEVQPGPYVWLEVADSGCGMDAETLSRIFDPFYSSKATGRGLGLAATIGIVRGHRGTLSVRSRPGRGATFRILLPASPRPAVSLAPTGPAAGAPGAHELLLVVDDEERVRGVARRTLERSGYRVLEAGSGEAALELLEGEARGAALVLLDLTMPGMGGEEALRELRRRRPHLPVVLSSGYGAESATRRLAAPSRPDAFVQKPYRGATLVRTVEEVLGRCARGR